MIGATIAKQLIRERLIARLLEKRECAVDISSDWSFVSNLGYTNALKKETVWGADGRAMMLYPGLRNLIWAARAADVVQGLGTFVCIGVFVWIYYFGRN